MRAPGSAGRRALAARLAGIGLAAAGVAIALYVAGRLHTPDVTSALFGFTVPIAAHCLFTYGVQYGVQLTSPRVAVHSLAGCFFYGAFAAKVLLVHSRRLPGWALPAAGGALAVAVAVLWYTSALWYYNGNQLPAVKSPAPESR